jgi:hypothetical protein
METGCPFLPKCSYPSRLTQCHTPDECNLNIHRRESLKFHDCVSTYASIQLRKFWMPRIKTYKHIWKVAAYSYITFAVHIVTLFTYFQTNSFQERDLLILALLHTYITIPTTLETMVFCDVMPYSMVFRSQYFGRTCYFKLQGTKFYNITSLHSHQCVNLKSCIIF